MPTISYFLSTTDHPVDEFHPLWHRPLPDNRRPGEIPPERVDTEAVTYGRYFSAISHFCAAAGWSRVIEAASGRLEQPVGEKDLGHLSLFLEKHGAFYHPARLRLEVKDQTLSFVINVAASSRGRQALARELAALECLNDQRPFGWFPRVYDSVSDGLPMFLGDWFDGFHEFHLTRHFESEDPAIVVWDGAVDRCILSQSQAADLYRSAAMILAACYDPITSCQIFPWHHAAGDFVARVERQRVTVRMITARDYLPLSGSSDEPDNEEAILDNLVAFFIHLSVRMRLDRLDGVADVVWAPDSCLKPLLDGFFQGLDLTSRMSGFPESFPEAFRHYVGRHDPTDLLATAHRITRAVFDPRTEEHRVIESHLAHHVSGILRILSTG